MQALLDLALLETPSPDLERITLFAPTDAAFELLQGDDMLPRLDDVRPSLPYYWPADKAEC